MKVVLIINYLAFKSFDFELPDDGYRSQIFRLWATWWWLSQSNLSTLSYLMMVIAVISKFFILKGDFFISQNAFVTYFNIIT
jgi:hypothetical protein